MLAPATRVDREPPLARRELKETCLYEPPHQVTHLKGGTTRTRCAVGWSASHGGLTDTFGARAVYGPSLPHLRTIRREVSSLLFSAGPEVGVVHLLVGGPGRRFYRRLSTHASFPPSYYCVLGTCNLISVVLPLSYECFW